MNVSELDLWPRRPNETVRFTDDLAPLDSNYADGASAILVAVCCFKVYGNKIVGWKGAIRGRQSFRHRSLNRAVRAKKTG